MEGLLRLLLVAGLLAAVLPAAAATFGPQPGDPCKPTLLATQVSLFCAPDMPTVQCCEPVVAAVDLWGGVPCLCRVAAEPQLIMAGLNARHLLTLYTSCVPEAPTSPPPVKVRAVSARYIMKCDDDNFVRIQSVMAEVKKISSSKSLYIGNMNYRHTPMRDGKWAVTYERMIHLDLPRMTKLQRTSSVGQALRRTVCLLLYVALFLMVSSVILNHLADSVMF